MKYCPKCKRVDVNACNFCDYDGTKLKQIKCPTCDCTVGIILTTNFCPNCGQQLTRESLISQPVTETKLSITSEPNLTEHTREA